jgi:hypothetical protein
MKGRIFYETLYNLICSCIREEEADKSSGRIVNVCRRPSQNMMGGKYGTRG